MGGRARHWPDLSSLPLGARVATAGGLVAAAAAATAMTVSVLIDGWSRLRADDTSDMVVYGLLLAAAFSAIAAGLALLGAASRLDGWPRPRATFAGAGVTALLVSASALALGQNPGGEGAARLTQAETLLLAWPRWLGAVAVVAVLAVTRGSGPASPVAAGATLLAPFAGVAASALTVVAFTGVPVYGINTLLASIFVLGFPAVFAPAAVLLWLAVEGLTGSRNAGLWLLSRARSSLRLLTGLLAAKVAVFAAAGALLASGSAPPGVTVLRPAAGAYLVAVPLVAAALWLLARESVHQADQHLSLAAKSSAFVFLGTLTPVTVYGVLALAAIAVSRRPVIVGLALLLLYGAYVVARGRHAPTSRLLLAGLGAATVATALPGLELLAGPVPAAAAGPAPVSSTALSSTPTTQQLALQLALALTTAVGVLVVVLRRPGLQSLLPFAAVLGLWMTATVLLPLLAGHSATPVAFDVILTAAIAAAALAWRTGLQRSVTPAELVLLLVVTTAVVEVPVVLAGLPQSWGLWLLVLAFLLPGLGQLTVGVGAFNAPGPWRVPRVLATTAVLCLGYGLLAILALAVPSAIATVRDLLEFANGLLGIPFAVLLVAASGTLAAARAPSAAQA